MWLGGVNAMGMEYIYAALMLHELKRKVEASDLEQVLRAAGAEPDQARIKQLVSAISNVNLDELISQAAVMPVAPAAAPAEKKVEEKKEEKKKEEGKEEEEAALAGLGALFG
ncbi:ribosomal protein 60S [Candidatus Korarchaeum cryptofilum OPF8]|jgi:large subunit ribosomal protein L12|uniref:Large ribosomal subunit protein P1 n=2 Tax=Candidatus Korarchaeum cryptofilum TaxID=498846 RepID=B1L761_KORCO|nr:ribosomal protein 60S [Candidatus Korarchaeum cryptofilum OPF8]